VPSKKKTPEVKPDPELDWILDMWAEDCPHDPNVILKEDCLDCWREAVRRIGARILRLAALDFRGNGKTTMKVNSVVTRLLALADQAEEKKNGEVSNLPG
jgi:hypothetical protein